MKTEFTFLVLDDDEDSRFLTRHALRKAFPGCRVIESMSPENALVAAHEAVLDGVVTDHHLGTHDGAVLMHGLRDIGVHCPVVMVTASSDPAVHCRAYAAGAARVFAGSDRDFVGYFKTLLSSR